MLRLTLAIIIILSAGSIFGAEARMYIVDQDGFAQYRSIGGVVDVANDGDTIYIKPGIYREHLVLDKRLTLMPLRGEEGVINLAGDGNDIGIEVLADGCKIEGLTVSDFAGPGIYVESKGNEIRNNVLVNNVHGIFLRGASENLIENNQQEGGYTGIVLLSSRDNAIKGNAAKSSIFAGVLLNSSSANAISGGRAEGCGRGIYLITESHENRLEKNSVVDCGYGVILEGSSSANTIIGSDFENATNAIALNFASKNVVRENSISYSTNGIVLFSATENDIFENDLSELDAGIMISEGSGENLLSRNRFENLATGIVVTDSQANVLEGNVLAAVRWGLYVDGSEEGSFNNQISESNQIDGKPILYLYRRSGEAVSGREFGHVTLAFCEGCTVMESAVSNDALFVRGSVGCKILDNVVSGGLGMRIEDSDGNEIAGNEVSDNRYSGIFLVESHENLIAENTLSRNSRNGLFLLGSDSNVVRMNVAEANGDVGMGLLSSNGTEITGNSIIGNVVGISIRGSSGSIVYRNNLIDNEVQAEDDGGNLWDWGVLRGGNYWSDHSCTGKPCQSAPRPIGDLAADYYPFGERDGWVR